MESTKSDKTLGVSTVEYGINNLPKNPNDLVTAGWEDITDPRMAQNSHRTLYKNPQTGHEVAFDKGQPGKPGWEGRDHYHIYNPNRTGKLDMFLDSHGNPVARGNQDSHIQP